MVDVTDSKSVGGDTVWVRVPPPAPARRKRHIACDEFFMLRIKNSSCAHSAAPPFQIEPAALGFDLVLGATMIAAASIVARCCKMRWQIPARGLSTPFYGNVKINHSLCPSDYVLFLTVEKLQKAVAVPPSLCYTLNRSATLSQF